MKTNHFGRPYFKVDFKSGMIDINEGGRFFVCVRKPEMKLWFYIAIYIPIFKIWFKCFQVHDDKLTFKMKRR